MKTINNKIFLILIISVFAIFTAVHATTYKNKIIKTGLKRYSDSEIIVKFKKDVSISRQMSAVNTMGDFKVKNLRNNMSHIKLKKGDSVENAIYRYNNNPDVEYAQPNYIYRISAIPNDTSYGQLWGLNNTGQTISNAAYNTNNPGTAGKDMDMQKAWDMITDCSSVVVAVIDTGVNYNHEDLAVNMWDDGSGHAGYDYVDDDNDPMDMNGHGTHCAGTIAAVGNNGTGIAGVCWSAKIMAVRVLDSSGSGYTSDIILGLNYAVAKGAKVVNFSLGGTGYDAAFSTAIDNARTTYGVLIIAAAGNENENNDSVPSYPASFSQDNIISVAALDQAYALASFSNYGATNVDVGAPGTNIRSTVAGTTTTITDDFNTSGSLDWNRAGSLQWNYQLLTDGTYDYDYLTIPSNWPFSYYGNNWDAQVYKTFSLTGIEAKVDLNFAAGFDVHSSDEFNIYYSITSNPVTGGTLLNGVSGSTGDYLYSFTYSLPDCAGETNCTVGFQLWTDSTYADYGVSILGRNRTLSQNYFYLETLTLNNNSYSVYNGTSMATPHVAGLATMLFAYNDGYGYTYLDAVNAIKNSGEDQSSLNGITSTGKSVNAFNALCYINVPEDLTVTLDL